MSMRSISNPHSTNALIMSTAKGQLASTAAEFSTAFLGGKTFPRPSLLHVTSHPDPLLPHE